MFYHTYLHSVNNSYVDKILLFPYLKLKITMEISNEKVSDIFIWKIG